MPFKTLSRVDTPYRSMEIVGYQWDDAIAKYCVYAPHFVPITVWRARIVQLDNGDIWQVSLTSMYRKVLNFHRNPVGDVKVSLRGRKITKALERLAQINEEMSTGE